MHVQPVVVDMQHLWRWGDWGGRRGGAGGCWACVRARFPYIYVTTGFAGGIVVRILRSRFFPAPLCHLYRPWLQVGARDVSHPRCHVEACGVLTLLHYPETHRKLKHFWRVHSAGKLFQKDRDLAPGVPRLPQAPRFPPRRQYPLYEVTLQAGLSTTRTTTTALSLAAAEIPLLVSHRLGSARQLMALLICFAPGLGA